VDESDDKTRVLPAPEEARRSSARHRLEPGADTAGMRSVIRALDAVGELGAHGPTLQDLEHEAQPPDLQLGAEKYRIVSELGEGGMGKVYLAYDRDLKRRQHGERLQRLPSRPHPAARGVNRQHPQSNSAMADQGRTSARERVWRWLPP
jgi:serine/threonine protein kinase